jgi:transposase
MARKRFTPEFREQACRLVTVEGYAMAEAAKSLGIHPNTLWNWLHPRGPADQPCEKQGDTPARGDAAADNPKAMAAQIRDLQSKVRRLEMEKEILKKATAYFATLHP